MASIVILSMALILHSSYGSYNFALARINISKDGDFDEFGRILHKPLILKKTTQIKVEDGGHAFDCVDINKQPALNHPLLTSHNIQSKPSNFRNFVPQPSSTTWFTGKSCPDGMVPVQRTPKKDYILSSTPVLNTFLNANLDNKNADSVHRKAVYLRMNGGPKKYGVYGYVSTYNLNVTKDQTSTANIWIYSGSSTRFSSLSAGWMVSPSMFGDKRARLFTHWTGDGHYKAGCYNTQCPGFVQVHKRVTPGFVLPKTSTYGGQQYALRVQIFQDHKTGNWWLGVSELDIFVGYWPKELLPYLSDGSDNVGWGGTAWAGKDGIYPPMGSGHLPDGDYTRACYFRNVSYENDIHQLHHPFPDQTEDSNNNKAGCYGFKNYHTSKGNLGYSFTFGGPGGKCD